MVLATGASFEVDIWAGPTGEKSGTGFNVVLGRRLPSLVSCIVSLLGSQLASLSAARHALSLLQPFLATLKMVLATGVSSEVDI